MEVKPNKEFKFDQDDFLWRYVDLHKLFSLLFEQKLFFTRLDNFEDPLEGLKEATLGHLDVYESTPNSMEKLNPSFTTEQKEKILLDREKRGNLIKEKTEKSQKTQFANCWFVGDKESFAMWNLYSTTDSVAIRYNPETLLNIVLPCAEAFADDDFKIFLYGFVEYDNIWPFNHFKKGKNEIVHTAFKKDKSYMHEREFRFVTVTPTRTIGKHNFFELPLGDISKDDFKVVVNPHMENWKVTNIERLLDQFGLKDKLIRSMLRVKQ